MSMKTFALAALITTAVAASPALAQETHSTFDGPYVGLQLGINRDTADARINNVQVLDKRVKRNTFSTGIYAGYNIPIAKSLVLSPEAGFSININDSVDGKAAGVVTYTLDPKRTFDLGTRLGVLAGKNTLVYLRGGYSNVRVRWTATQPDGTKQRSNQTVSGWNLGAGIEQALGGGISARAEYRFTKLDRNGGDWRRHQVLAGIAYNF